MRSEIVELIESVRSLRLYPTGDPSPRCVRFAIEPSVIPERLLRIQKALEAVDKASSNGYDDASYDVDKLQTAVDGLMRWIAFQGLTTKEPYEILRESLNGRKRPKKKLVVLPKYAPDVMKRKKKWTPNLKAKVNEIRNSSDLLREANEMEQVYLKFNNSSTPR